MIVAAVTTLLSSCSLCSNEKEKEPVDYVNPYIGNISHLLVPTFPTVHLPNSMMRVYPVREDFTTDFLKGLPLIVPDHRKGSVLNMIPYSGEEKMMLKPIELSYDNEEIAPYRYKVELDEVATNVDFAPSHQSALYELTFNNNQPHQLLFPIQQGSMSYEGNTLSGYAYLVDRKSKVYIFAEMDVKPIDCRLLRGGKLHSNTHTTAEKPNSTLVLSFASNTPKLGLRYGISFISVEQAKKNLHREINHYDVDKLAMQGREIWNDALSKIEIVGGTEKEMSVFYTALYRTFERPVVVSEDGKYYSAFDNKIHNDGGRPYMLDDWLWDTYRATHPLRLLIDKEKENDIINSYITMAGYKEEGRRWLPTFPKITGDSHGMNCNHGIISVWDAWSKGARDFDLEKAFDACQSSIEDKTLIPWSDAPAGELDAFYKEHGYFPALHPSDEETVPHVGPFECRQAVAVTLGTAYDQWALSRIANELGYEKEAAHYANCGLNYRNVFNPATGFFHPKDKDGKLIPNVDYRYSRGVGARHYYDENNAYTYRWAVQHNITDLIAMMGGSKDFSLALDSLFSTPLGMSKYQFYKSFGADQSGNVGQFSMGNEPSFHIPYLYNYAGEPWKTQKRIRTLLNMWFRSDLMGIPGDEDGGGMSAFVVFSQLGFYPVTPGLPYYSIGSPSFEYAKVNLSDGGAIEIKAPNASYKNKYIQSVKLNGKEWNKTWFSHADIEGGALFEFVMGSMPNLDWAAGSPLPPTGYEN